MDKKIFKWRVRQGQYELPLDRQFLSLQVQDGTPQMWWLVNTDRDTPVEKCKIEVYGTGDVVFEPGQKTYLGTWQESGGILVWHVFITKIS